MALESVESLRPGEVRVTYRLTNNHDFEVKFMLGGGGDFHPSSLLDAEGRVIHLNGQLKTGPQRITLPSGYSRLVSLDYEPWEKRQVEGGSASFQYTLPLAEVLKATSFRGEGVVHYDTPEGPKCAEIKGSRTSRCGY